MQGFFKLFELDTSDPELTRAQFRTFQGHIPLLYVILVCNTVAITVTAFEPDAIIKTLLSPIAISALALYRAVWWLRQGNANQFDDIAIAMHLRRTCRLAVIMTLTFNAWVIWVFQDAGAFARSNLTFFLALSQVSTVFCLMTLRAAALRGDGGQHGQLCALFLVGRRRPAAAAIAGAMLRVPRHGGGHPQLQSLLLGSRRIAPNALHPPTGNRAAERGKPPYRLQ